MKSIYQPHPKLFLSIMSTNARQPRLTFSTILLNYSIRAILYVNIFGFCGVASANAPANNTSNETLSGGVGEYLYPCSQNQLVCKPELDCWANPTTNLVDRSNGWTCLSGHRDGCSCQRILTLSKTCGSEGIVSHMRRIDTSLKRSKPAHAAKPAKPANATTIDDKVAQLNVGECPADSRCVNLNERNIPFIIECVHCNIQIPGMTYQMDDAVNCNGKNQKNESLSLLPEPCSPVNQSAVCKNSTECMAFEVDRDSNFYLLRPCTNSKMKDSPLGCYCALPNGFHSSHPCQTSIECQDGERCAKTTFYDYEFVCVSCQADPSLLSVVADDGKEHCRPPCIAVDALRDFEQDDLVFPKHIRASVLCDTHGNCATPGHIVIHTSKSMMMKSYCGLPDVECRYRVKYVNSPRMKMGIRILSFSDDFMYTAFAAKHESLIEEYLLSAIIRANF